MPARSSTAPIPGPIVPVPITAARLISLISSLPPWNYLRTPAASLHAAFGASPSPQFLDSPPHPLRGERKLCHRHAGVGERGRDRRRGRRLRVLPAALRPVGPGAVG